MSSPAASRRPEETPERGSTAPPPPPALFRISPHPQAPLFSQPDALDILDDAIIEAGSSSMSTVNQVIRSVLRQASLVSLWFYLRFVAGHNGPFQFLQNQLALELCAFYQDVFQVPGLRVAIFMPRFHGKDIKRSEPILTYNRGWTTHGDLQVGDFVFSPSGEPAEVQALSPTYTDNSCYRITFWGGDTVECGEGHLWNVIGWMFPVPTVELTLGDVIGVLENPLQYPEADLPIHPYMMGVWLGDGTSTGARITQSFEDSEVMDRLRDLGYDSEAKAGSTSTTGNFAVWETGKRYKHNTLAAKLRDLGVWGNKHIPHAYLTASETQRMDLLRGLMDTDGTSHRSTATFSNKDYSLSRQVYELATGLGLRPRIREKRGVFQGEIYLSFEVAFQHHEDRQPFYLERKRKLAFPPTARRDKRTILSIERIASVPTSCIQVDGQRYLVGTSLIPTHNSTVFTMGGPAWEADRNPEECHLITNAVKEGAEEFVGVIKDIADSNELHGYLFPETIPPRNATRWNQRELVWPNRRRNWKEPTFRPAGAEGAAEGRHFHDHRMDDLVGLGQLDAARRSNVEMRKRRDWATSNEFSLLRGPSSRLWSIGTRFATDDIYTFITEDIKEIHGYRSMDLQESPTGRWIVYNREWKEDGRIICPEMVNDEMMDTLSRTDPWTVATQMQNQPSSSLLNELQRYPVGECALTMHDDLGWVVIYPPGAEGASDRPLSRPLAAMDLGMGVDPAATERYINARTSRSAIVLWAMDEDGNYILIDGVVDYMETFDMYDHMFDLRERYKGPYRVCVLEKQGPFRLLGPQLDRIQKTRGRFLNIEPGGGGDKDAAIRAALTDPLGRGKVFLVKDPPMSRLREAPSIYGEWLREKNSFPQSHLKDCLDATRLIWPALIRPLGASEREAKERANERFRSRSASVTGY